MLLYLYNLIYYLHFIQIIELVICHQTHSKRTHICNLKQRLLDAKFYTNIYNLQAQIHYTF